MDKVTALQKEEMERIIAEECVGLFEAGAYDELTKCTNSIKEKGLRSRVIREICNMMEIYGLEMESVCGNHSEWFEFGDWQRAYEYYCWVRFVLLRMSLGRDDERIEQLKSLIANRQITKDALLKAADTSLRNVSPLYQLLGTKVDDAPLVSVVITVYNAEDVIGETLRSVLNQSYRNIEVIVVDDASTDHSAEVIRSFEDPRIKPVFLEKNRHVCYAENVGFSKAAGKYVAPIGHDDIWKEDKLEKQVAFMEEHPAFGVCFSWFDVIDENGAVATSEMSEFYQIFTKDNFSQDQWSRMLFMKGNSLCGPSACIRREFLERVGYNRYALVQLQDYDLWLRLLGEGPIYVYQEKLTGYRRFSTQGRNLSEVNQKNENRDWHEKQWIQHSYMEKLKAERFLQIFEVDLRNHKNKSEKAVRCEKAFLLWEMGNCFAEKDFIELLEDEECRDILERDYQFELKDFYRMNEESMFFDYALLDTIRKQK